MSFGAYLAGAIGLAVVAATLGYAGVRVRRTLLAGWEGAPAVLAAAVLSVAGLTALMQLLGAAGVIGPVTLVAGAAVLALGAHRFARPPDPGASGGGPPDPGASRVAALIALGAAVFVAAHWATGLQDAWARGMLTFDSLWYHGPFAARIAAEGTVWPLHFTDPIYLNWFYPQNSELQHAAGIALFGRDLISPLQNFGWLGMALLAGWCIGRPYGVAPLSLIAVALVLDTGPMVPREAGTLANDVAPLALLLAAVAILVNAWAARSPGAPAPDGLTREGSGALVAAGLALGLALGTKLTIAGPAAAMAVAVPLLARPGTRRRAGALFVGGAAITCGFWFLRNLIHSGSPLPWAGEVGPVDLPGPDRGLEGRDPYSVAHYVFAEPDTGVWREWFLPGIRNLFGPLWPAFLVLGAAGAVAAIARPRGPAIRLAGIVAVVGAIAYLFTPLTAAGPEGEPRAFTINLRYLLPALALALALLPTLPGLAPPALRSWIAAGGAVALVITALYSDSAAIWNDPHTHVPAAALIALVLIALPVGISALSRRSGRGAAALAASAAFVAIAAVGWERQDDYFAGRYADPEDFRFQLDEMAEFAEDTEGLRIGVVGSAGAYNQYLLYGEALDNHVQYIGRTGPSGDFRPAQKCPAFRRALNAGDYDYVVTTSTLDLNAPDTDRPAPERSWIAGAPQTRLAGGASRVGIFAIEGELAPGRCPGRGERR